MLRPSKVMIGVGVLPSIVVGDITELSISAMSIAPLERWSHESFSDSEKQIVKVSLICKTILERERERERERLKIQKIKTMSRTVFKRDILHSSISTSRAERKGWKHV